jgi:flagellar motility protein MotE (MotC chaperone)
VADSGLSTDEVRLQLMQADLLDALRAQLAEKESRIEVLERLLAEKDTRLVERDERIAALQRRVRALADVE